jgi:hypothetical protein
VAKAVSHNQISFARQDRPRSNNGRLVDSSAGRTFGSLPVKRREQFVCGQSILVEHHFN